MDTLERELETVILPSGDRVQICQEMKAYDPGEYVPGLKFIRVDGEIVPLPWGRDLLINAGRFDVVERHRIPA
jgi:hypothetical protein